MGKSNRTGRRMSPGTITVIDARVHRNSARKARASFVVTALVTSFSGMIVATQWASPVLAFIIGTITGLVLGVVAWAAV